MKPAIVCLLLLAAVLGSAQRKPDARGLIEAQISRLEQAYAGRDFEGVRSVMAATFQGIGIDRHTYSLAAYLQQVKLLFSMAKEIKLSVTIQSLAVDKGSCRVFTKEILDFKIPNSKKKLDAFRVVSSNEEIWVPSNGVFKISIEKQKSQSRMVNGRPAGHS